MSQLVHQILTAAWGLCMDMAPYLLLGFLAAGLLRAFLPLVLVSRHLGGDRASSVLKAALLGVPLPLCSCGVLPVAASLRGSGVGRAPTAAFLITTPVTGVDSLLATWGLLGAAFTFARLAASLIIGVFVGLATAALKLKDDVSPAASCVVLSGEARDTLSCKLRDGLRYGLVELPGEIGGSLVAGLLLGGLITVLVPADVIDSYVGSGMLGMLAAVAVAVPLYVCATGSLPIAAAMMMKGFSPGAALAFLIAGPATNAVALTTVRKLLGAKVLAVYLASILVGAILLGFAFDLLSARFGLHHVAEHAHGASPSAGAFSVAAAVSLMAMLLMAWGAKSKTLARLLGRMREKRKGKTGMGRTVRLSVPGMTCSHCERTVRGALGGVAGVRAVNVDLGARTVTVSLDEGVTEERLKGVLSWAGYESSEA